MSRIETSSILLAPVWPHTFVSPSAFSRRAVVSYWRKYVHEVLVNRLGGLSLPRKSVVRLTDRPDMTLDVYRGRKTTNQQSILPAWNASAQMAMQRNDGLSFSNLACKGMLLQTQINSDMVTRNLNIFSKF